MNNTFPTSKTSASSRLARRQRAVVVALAVWATLIPGFVLFAVWKNPVHRAVLGMAWGLIMLWIGGGGLIMWHWRDPWDRLAAKVRLPWMLKFVLGCTALALIEEAVTTLMTNCTPLFGVRVGEAYITSWQTISTSCFTIAWLSSCPCSLAGR